MATQLVRPSTVWDHIRSDHAFPKQHVVDSLHRSIDQFGYHSDWDHVDGPIKVDLSGDKPVVSNGSHRLHVLKQRGMDDPIPMQVTSALSFDRQGLSFDEKGNVNAYKQTVHNHRNMEIGHFVGFPNGKAHSFDEQGNKLGEHDSIRDASNAVRDNYKSKPPSWGGIHPDTGRPFEVARPHDAKYLRFGRPPANERSRNHLDNFHEEGVSAYDLHHGYPVDTGNGDSLHQFIDEWRKGEKRAFVVSGDQHGEGSDTEPVLRNVKVHGEWNPPGPHKHGEWHKVDEDLADEPEGLGRIPESHIKHTDYVHRLQAARFTPSLRVFTHTCGLDHRLWDANEHLKPEVRDYIMGSVALMWSQKYIGWSHWANVYFAGSEASEWTSDTLEGNNDFDVLIGVDYSHFRDSNPAYRTWSNHEITDEMNQGFREYNGPKMLEIDGVSTGPWDRTTYVNEGFDDHGSFDLSVIRPYAAYSVSQDRWVVKPPHLPHWSLSDLPRAVQTVLRASDSLARDVLKLSEPERTQQGSALFDAWHTDRSRAFGPNGEGWYDIANLREKWLDQAGLWAELVECKHRFDEGLGASGDWTNTPGYYSMKAKAASLAKIAMPWFDDGSIAKPRAKSTRRAGFAGFVADHQWTREFGDDKEADVPDHVDDHLAHFVRNHSAHWETWEDPDRPGRGVTRQKISLKQPIYATQSHVSQHHIDRYKRNPNALSHNQEEGESDYPGHYTPLFVTHQGRLHAIEGHHRVAAGIQKGEDDIEGLHYNLDENPHVKNSRGQDCLACVRHNQLAGMSHTSARVHDLYGKGLDAMFPGGGADTVAPFPQAGRRKSNHDFDRDLVARSITHPEEFSVEKHDPRELRATQPKVVRAGVQHYIEHGSEGETYGSQNGNDTRLGNDIPRVYHRIDDDQKLILTGHHRAAASLAKGEPFDAITIKGGWGPPR